MTTCTCTLIEAPELDGEFGPGTTVQVIKLNPGCPVHTGPPNPLCRACTEDYGPCTCMKPCGTIVCTGGYR
jgi:hypothetical protein